MTFPDACPNCGAVAYADTSETRRMYVCGSFINAGRERLADKSDTCDDWRTIKDAAAVIRAFLDGDRDAREKGFDWIAENTP